MEKLKKFFKKVYLTVIHYFNSEVKYRRFTIYYSLLSLCCLIYFNNLALFYCLLCGFYFLDYTLHTKMKRRRYYINIILKSLLYLCVFVLFFAFFIELFDTLVASKRTTKIHNIRRSAFYYTLDNECVIFITPNKKEMYCNIYHQIQYGKVKQHLITCKISNKKTLFVFSPDEFVNYFNSEVVEGFINSLGNNNKDLKNELLSILKQQKFNV